MSGTQRAHILIPVDLLREIDAIVGPRGRSAFLLETAREEVRRRKLLHFLESDNPAWQEQDHPELGKGSRQWVKKCGRKARPVWRRLAPRSRAGRRNPANDRASMRL